MDAPLRLLLFTRIYGIVRKLYLDALFRPLLPLLAVSFTAND